MRQVLYVSSDFKKLLFSLSNGLGISVSQLIRECINYALSSQEFMEYLGLKGALNQVQQKKREIKTIRKLAWEYLEAKEQLRVAEKTLQGENLTHRKKYILYKHLPPKLIAHLMKKEDEIIKILEKVLEVESNEG